MKKLLFLLIALLPIIASAQTGQSVVILKNGTELKGTIKSIDPTDAVTLVIAGVETKIKMADVAKIEEANQVAATVPFTQEPQLGENDKLTVTDTADYPESFDLQVGNSKIKMILVRGGDMNMGYDGPGSRSMDSEPVHKVTLTSYYLSETFVTTAIVQEVTGKAYKGDFYKESEWKKINNLVQSIAEKSNIPVRLPTEAEWEYAACSPVQNLIFNVCKKPEVCNDYYDNYKAGYEIDPIGPTKKYAHVARAYERKKGKLDRSGLKGVPKYYFRLAVKVKDVIDKIN